MPSEAGRVELQVIMGSAGKVGGKDFADVYWEKEDVCGRDILRCWGSGDREGQKEYKREPQRFWGRKGREIEIDACRKKCKSTICLEMPSSGNEPSLSSVQLNQASFTLLKRCLNSPAWG